MEMKTKRGFYPQAEMSLFMPLLAMLSPTVSLVAVMMFLSDRENSKRELEFPLRMLAADKLAPAPHPVTPPSIIIEAEEMPMPKNYVYDHSWEKNLRNLRTKILEHLTKRDAEKIVIYVEPDARYEMLIEVLNTFAACKTSQYQIVFLSPFVGPRLHSSNYADRMESHSMTRVELRLNF